MDAVVVPIWWRLAGPRLLPSLIMLLADNGVFEKVLPYLRSRGLLKAWNPSRINVCILSKINPAS